MEAFDTDRAEVIERALEAGIERLLVPGYDAPSSERAVELAHEHPQLIDAAVGIHPHYAAAADEAAWRRIEALAADRAVVAIGEIGLDFFRNLSPQNVQHLAFERQLDLARRVAKPVLVHDRDAHEAVGAALERWAGPPHRSIKGVLHCFSGDAAMATRLAATGYLVSFALPVTFSSARGPRAAAAALPSGTLLTETDSPWLGAGAGRRNEPTTALRVAAELARLRGTTPQQLSAEVAAAYGRLVAG